MHSTMHGTTSAAAYDLADDAVELDSENMLTAVMGEFFWILAGFTLIHILVKMKGKPALASPRTVKKIISDHDADSVVPVRDQRGPPGLKHSVSSRASAKQSKETLSAWNLRHKLRSPLLFDSSRTSSKAEHPELALELSGQTLPRLGSLRATVRTQEILLADFASQGDEQKVAEIQSAAALRGDLTMRGCVLVLKGFFKCSKLDAAAQQMAMMCREGMEVPPWMVTELFKRSTGSAAAVNRHQQLLDALNDDVCLPTEGALIILETCVAAGDVCLASRVERLLQEQGTPKSFALYDPLLKVYTRARDPKAMALFADMDRDGFFASEGLCGSLLARCGEARDLAFAEVIAGYLRRRSMMTLATYKTLMKVYVCCGKFESACDLYHEVIAAGVEPDHVMYGCLLKFSVKCGKTDLTEELLERSKITDVKNFTWFSRAAGREVGVLDSISSHRGKMPALRQKSNPRIEFV